MQFSRRDHLEFQRIFKSKSISQYYKYIEVQRKNDNIIVPAKLFLNSTTHRSNLSPSQKGVEGIVKEHLAWNKGKQLLLALYGQAGTGKSRCVELIKKAYEEKKKNVIILGPTGYSVIQYENAQTIHSFFGILPVPNAALESLVTTPFSSKLYNTVRKASLIIIDEVGMVSACFFEFINRRLSFLRKRDLAFGGLDIVIIFDPLQLQCINSNALWSDPKKSKSEFEQSGIDVFKRYQFVKLKENMRQQDDKEYENILKNFRYHCVTESDVERLRTRLKSNLSREEVEEFEQKGTSLYCTNEGSDSYNKASLESLSKPIFDAPVLGCQPQQFAEGCRVMLTRNLWTEAGLASGQTGTVVGVLYGKKAKIGIDAPEVIFVKFDKRHKIRTVERESVPIPRVKRTIFNNEIDRKAVVRYFPLQLAFAMTIAKSQSATFNKIRIFFGKEFVPQMFYVALSRVRSLKDLMIVNETISLSTFMSCSKTYKELIDDLNRLGLEDRPETTDEITVDG